MSKTIMICFLVLIFSCGHEKSAVDIEREALEKEEIEFRKIELEIKKKKLLEEKQKEAQEAEQEAEQERQRKAQEAEQERQRQAREAQEREKVNRLERFQYQYTDDINEMFLEWGAKWSVDNYINNSAKITAILNNSSPWRIQGTFNFNRFGSRKRAIFTAYITIDGSSYSISDLCYDYNGEKSCNFF